MQIFKGRVYRMLRQQFRIKNILVFSFLSVVLIAICLVLSQQCFWLSKHERGTVEKDYLPVAESVGRTIDIILNERVLLLKHVSEEVLKAGLHTDKAQKIVENAHYRNPLFKTVWVGDINGKATAFSPLYDKEGKINIGRDYSDRGYYKKVKETKKPVIGNIVVGRVAREIIIPLAVPILDKDGNFKGLVVAAYDPSNIEQVII